MAKFGSSFKDFLYYIKNKKCVINGHSGLKNWRSAINQLKNGEEVLFNLNFVGDSITEGYMSTDMDNKSFVGLIRNELHDLFGNTGFGCIPYFYPYGDTPKWTLSGTWADYFNVSGVGMKMKKATTSGPTATLNFNGTGIGIMVYRYTDTSTFSVSIDGGDPINYDTVSATKINSYVYEITGLEDGDHTAIITSTGTNLSFQGGYVIKGDVGIRTNMVGKGGSSTSIMCTGEAVMSEIEIFSPVLTIIGLISNDFSGQTSLTTYKNFLRNTVTKAKTYGDVILFTVGLRNLVKTIPQSEYVRVNRELAIENDVVLVDLFSMWHGDYDYANNLGWMADASHLTDAGYEEAANTLLKVLLN